jgi:hypothetical protein
LQQKLGKLVRTVSCITTPRGEVLMQVEYVHRGS